MSINFKAGQVSLIFNLFLFDSARDDVALLWSNANFWIYNASRIFVNCFCSINHINVLVYLRRILSVKK